VRQVEAPHLVLQRAPKAAWAEIEQFLQPVPETSPPEKN
jgi:hypothetical protein